MKFILKRERESRAWFLSASNIPFICCLFKFRRNLGVFLIFPIPTVEASGVIKGIIIPLLFASTSVSPTYIHKQHAELMLCPIVFFLSINRIHCPLDSTFLDPEVFTKVTIFNYWKPVGITGIHWINGTFHFFTINPNKENKGVSLHCYFLNF